MPTGPVITRFAPSPTGHLHIGGARSALFCWAFARRAELEHLARGGAPGQGGRFMIRIEDTDQARSSEESARGILEDLAWLGIMWDDGPALPQSSPLRPRHFAPRDVGSYFQAQRAAAGIYNSYIESLVKSGRAYPAFETSEELDAMRKACTAEKKTFKYPRPADVKPGVFNEARWKRAGANTGKGDPHVIRFLMDDQGVTVHDQVLGDVKIAPGEVDDFVIRKADGFPTYHFAVVIDDELMGVTHVLRAQEHLANTPRHVAMQRALKRLDNGEPFRTPVYAHMPLIFNMDGSKMSKRDKAKVARKAIKDAMAKDKSITAAALAPKLNLDEKTLAAFIAADNDSLDVATAIARHLNLTLPEIEVWDYRQSGYLPEAIINFIALLGWNPGMKLEDGKDLEKFDMDFLARHFSIDRIGKTNAKFDRAKLLSFNADAISKLSDEAFAARWQAFLAEYEPAALARLKGAPSASSGDASATTPRFQLLASVIKPRARTLRDGLTAARFALIADTGYDFDPKALDKLRASNPKSESPSPQSPIDLLSATRDRLSTLSDWTAPTIHTLLEQLATQLGLPPGNQGVGQLAQPLRIAVTGTTVSPGIAETLAILGKESTLVRIDRCLALLRT
jgi:glutamyl-tRNA synthetase